MRVNNIFSQSFSFLSKKTLYTDFDGTYFPFVSEDVKQKNRSKFEKMYLPFDTFSKSQKDDFELVVITGRSKNEFLNTQERIKQEGLPFLSPDCLISSNGSSIFLMNKRGGIKDITPRDEDDRTCKKVIDNIKRLIRKNHPDIPMVECEINGTKDKYGRHSSEAMLKRKGIKGKYISIARDGRYDAEFITSKEVNGRKLEKEIKSYIDENGLPFTVKRYKDSPFTLVPEFISGHKTYKGANIISVKHEKNGYRPNKSEIIKDKLRQIKETSSDEKVVVAGDAFNDFKMLNPLSYLEVYMDEVPDEPLKSPKALEVLRQMPLRVILCGTSSDLEELRRLAKKLSSFGIDMIKLAPDSLSDYPRVFRKTMDEIE